ncbi:hypothetical protein LCGC14_0862790 [marine sediment metagenome]|uniref:Uncharacterized protein n=1 Tax=marine sediment metagenome TaxID=412755 RepID=A0A0F9PSF9_9ZZZZ|nr:hypothetical protein [Candidatus Scalindua sp.]HDZ27913.1 hypothetical protein [Candidatus Aminicenantes bacterium]
MPECEGCHQERRELINGLCILCRRGPGGSAIEKKIIHVEHRERGKIIKEAISTGNRGVWKKERKRDVL